MVDVIKKRGKMWTWPVTLLLGTGWWFRFTTRPLYVHGAKAQHAFNRGLCLLQSRSRRYGEEKCPSLRKSKPLNYSLA